jgi:hypothetical protein
MSSAPTNVPSENLWGVQFPAPVVALTLEQSRSPVVEVRNYAGTTLGFLINSPEVTLYLTSAEMAELKRRASAPVAGRTTQEVLEMARQRAGG